MAMYYIKFCHHQRGNGNCRPKSVTITVMVSYIMCCLDNKGTISADCYWLKYEPLLSGLKVTVFDSKLQLGVLAFTKVIAYKIPVVLLAARAK